MRVLSLFDGMACGHIALTEMGIPIEKYDAYEIDKYAISTATHNFPDIVEKGNVFDEDFSQYEGQYDILMSGFPCTKFSIAQKNDRETQPYSGEGWDMFMQTYKAIHEVKPKCFLLENNKSMSKDVQNEINRLLGFEPMLINSALVSAQNRQRYYWCGIRQDDGTYCKADIEQPEDRGILLKDILESGCDLTSNNKSYCMTSSYDGAVPWNTIERNQRNMVAEPVGTTADDKSYAVTAYYSTGQNAPHTIEKHKGTMVAEPINTYNDEKEKSRTLMSGYYKYGTATLITNDGFKGGTTAVAEPINVTEDGKGQVLKANYYKSSNANFFNGNDGMKYAASGVAEPINITEEGKAVALKAQYYKDNVSNFVVHSGAYGFKSSGVAEPCRIPPYGADDKSRPVEALYPNHSGTGEGSLEKRLCSDNPNKQQVDLVADPIRVGSLPRPNGDLSTSQAFRIYSTDGKSVGLKAQGGGAGGKTGLYAIPTEFDENDKPIKAKSLADGKTYTVYEVKNELITIKGKQYPIKLKDGYYIIRKLTVKECMRLQTVPEWYEFVASDTQAYKMLGNGWTIEVIKHLLKGLIADDERRVY